MTKRSLDAVQMFGQIILLLALAGCAAPSQAAPVPSPSGTPGRGAATLGAGTPTRGPAGADRLYVTGTDETGASRLFVLNSASGEAERSLPSGYIAPDWSTLYQVTQAKGATEIRAYDITTGRMLRETTIDGVYDAPVPAEVPSRSPFSPDGKWLVLAGLATEEEMQTWHATGKPRTRLLVLDTSFDQRPRRIDLEGNFGFDALSTGGLSLFLIQVLDPGWPPEYGPGRSPHYQVRRYDTDAGRLDEQPVIDKSEDGPMNGGWHASVGDSGGTWLYSLYTRDTEGPFVHVLNLNDRYAVCVDLPFPTSRGDFEGDLMWSLALAPDETTLYAVNTALGQVAAINTETFEVRSARLPRSRAQMPNMLAQLGRWLMPVAEAKRMIMTGVAVSPDGKMLYAVDSSGLVAIATSDLSLRGRFMDGWALSSLAVSPAGDALYVSSDAKGAMARIALPAGARPSPVPVATGVYPTGVLRVGPDR